MPRAAFVYTDAFTDYHLSDTHPLQQRRLQMTHRLLERLGAFDRPGSHLIAPTTATRADLLRVHTPEYLDALQALSRGENVPQRGRFGFGSPDNPPFAGMWEASLLYAGASLDCARLVLEGGYDAAFNTSGGLHHARPDRAAGFCTVADVPLVVCFLLDRGVKRVAVVDIDAHHGDGTQAFFYDDPRVLTLSVHETPETLYPRKSGFAGEAGTGPGLGFNVNLPLLPGTGDADCRAVFDAAILPRLTAFDPEIVILQVGADAHFSDPLAHLCLTSRGWLGLAEAVLALGHPTIALGGGGYHLESVARLWALLYGALAGLELGELHDTSGPTEAERQAVFAEVWGRRSKRPPRPQ